MVILFYSLKGERSDYLAEGLLYGLKKLYDVIDIPKRQSLYSDSRVIFIRIGIYGTLEI